MSVKRKLLASQLTQKINRNKEEALRKAVADFFLKQLNLVLVAFDEYYKEEMLLQGHLDLILAPIHEMTREYYEMLLEHNLDMYRRGETQAKRLVNTTKENMALKAAKTVDFLHDNKDKYTQHFGTLQYSEDYLTDYTFTATEKTMSRVDNEINKILTTGYQEGWGVPDVRNKIMERYNQFSSWEANRIARTEMQTAHNMGMMNQYQNMGVKYKEWRAAHDKRTRRSHAFLDGEITPLDEPFSNGLMFPGDKTGPVEEWINCRCSAVPYLMPPDSTAPVGRSTFTANDLVKVSEPNYGRLLQKETGGALNWQQYKQVLHGKPLEQVLAGVTVPQTKQEPVKVRQQHVEKPVVKQPKKTETNSEYLFKGEPKKSTLRDRKSGKTMDVYEYDNIKIAFDRGETALTFEEVKAHIDSLPPIFKKTNSKIIKIHDWEHRDAAGSYSKLGSELNLYKPKGYSKQEILDTFTHELAHSIDSINGRIGYQYSTIEKYEKIFKADNKLYRVLNERTGRYRTPKKFPTDYAKRSWLKYKKSKDHKKLVFVEDFAESTKEYLNPLRHEEFVKKFPNRAEYLEEIYGKPVFDKKSPLMKAIAEEGDIKKIREKNVEDHYKKQQEAYEKQKLQDKKFEELSKQQLDKYLKEVLSSDTHVQAYYGMVEELKTIKAIEDTIMMNDPTPLMERGYSKEKAKKVLENPNYYLNKNRDIKNKYRAVISEVEKLNNDDLDTITKNLLEHQNLISFLHL